MTSELLQIRWHQCPITGIHFVSDSKLLLGSGNRLQLYDYQTDKLLQTYRFREFITIHHLDVQHLDGSHLALAVAGDRFYAGLVLVFASNQFTELWSEYQCDNIVHCSINSFGCGKFNILYLSAHGEVILKRTCLQSACPTHIGDVISSRAKSSLCYSGTVVGINNSEDDYYEAVSFTGSTFGCIEIEHHLFQFKFPNRGVCTSTHYTSLRCQKGAVFSIAIMHATDCVRLVAAAENRSIAVWTRELNGMKTNGSTAELYLGPWTLSNLLVGGSLDENVIFEARIWKVFVNEKGLFASGEDCRIVWYPWDSMHKRRILSNIHRGHGIWCIDVWQLPSGDDLLVASGGNDGAVCISTLTNNEPKAISVALSPTHLSEPVESSTSSVHRDFARCLFFGPTGRVFYLTDKGYFHTVDMNWSEASLVSPLTVQPLFRHTVVEQLHRVADVDLPIHSAEPDSLIQSSDFPLCQRLFRGYTVSASNQSQTLTVIGDKQGQLGLFQVLTDAPYLVCTDLRNLGQKVMQLTWLDDSTILVGLQNGPAVLMATVSLTGPSSLFIFSNKTRQLHLPPGSSMRWANSGCLVRWTGLPSRNLNEEITIVVIGARDGGLYSYRTTNRLTPSVPENPQWFLECCHGRGGCTALANVSTNSISTVISCGRTHGELRHWLVTPKGNLILIGLIPSSSALTWVERFYQTTDGHLFALGFHSANFKAYLLSAPRALKQNTQSTFTFDCLLRTPTFQANCGGGNRYWEWWTPVLGEVQPLKNFPSVYFHHFPILASVHRGDVTLHSYHQPMTAAYVSNTPHYIRPSLHGRDINCCLLFSVPLLDSNENDALIFYCFAGGEDTDLSSWALKMDTRGQPDAAYYHQPEHHRGHISNIRCLTTPFNVESHVSQVGKYIVSGGGRGQIGLWRINLTSESFWRPGWLGSIRIALITSTSKQVEDPGTNESELQEDAVYHLTTSSHTGLQSTDLRVMALVSVALGEQNCAQEPVLLTISACSDGSIRLIAIRPPTEAYPRTPKFTELGALHQRASNLSNRSPRCYLDLKLLYCKSNKLCVVASNTGGECECWSVQWLDELNDPECFCSTLDWILTSEPIQPFYRNTNPAFNCVDIDLQRQFMFVGADDGSLRVASIPSWNDKEVQPKWLIAETCHFTTIVRLLVLPPEDDALDSIRLVTLSADQRLILWQFSTTDTKALVLTPLQRSIVPGIGDPHGLALNVMLSNSSSKRSSWVLATGTGSFLVQI